MKTYIDTDAFFAAYLDAALWTCDKHPNDSPTVSDIDPASDGTTQ